MAKTDEEKVAFMRAVGATHATWGLASYASKDEEREEYLSSITLGPVPTSAPRQPGPAQRMADFHAQRVSPAQRQHDILFAASSVRPKLNEEPHPNAVPRAVRAKEAMKRRGSTEG